MSSSSEAVAVRVKGHCYCGAVEYAVEIPAGEGPLFPPCYCSCESCRRSHGAPMYHVVCIDRRKHFTVTRGSDRLKKFHKPGAPNGITRCFCDVCGTMLLKEFDEGVVPGRFPMVFFPNTLREEDQANFPEMFRPRIRVQCSHPVPPENSAQKPDRRMSLLLQAVEAPHVSSHLRTKPG